MVTIKITENPVGLPSETSNGKIRRYFDAKAGIWYFSIVDVIAALTDSSDARNYWKVLKNRLKKADNELVTRCNQLKMKARDGKFYMTDTADSETLIRIIEAIPKASVKAFKLLVKDIIEGKIGEDYSPNQIHLGTTNPLDENEIIEPEAKEVVDEKNSDTETLEDTSEAELLVDAYQTASEIFIIAMVAGVDENSLQISLKNKKITLSGRKINPNPQKEYLCNELLFSTFSRTIPLPAHVQENNIEKILENGKLIVRLIKII